MTNNENEVINPEVKAQILDNEHLKLLSIAYYVLGGVNAFFAFIPLIYAAVGIMIIGIGSSIPNKPSEPPLAIIGWMFLLVATIVFFVIAIFAILKIYAGICIARRKHRIFCYVVAALSCLSVPFGTLLGIFTFIVLSRPTVAELFEEKGKEALPPAGTE